MRTLEWLSKLRAAAVLRVQRCCTTISGGWGLTASRRVTLSFPWCGISRKPTGFSDSRGTQHAQVQHIRSRPRCASPLDPCTLWRRTLRSCVPSGALPVYPNGVDMHTPEICRTSLAECVVLSSENRHAHAHSVG